MNSILNRKFPAGAMLAGLLLVLGAPRPSAAEGTWIPLTNAAPEDIGTMLLLPDGTVMAQGAGSGAQATSRWYSLVPDITGNYIKGYWQARQSMHYTRLYYSSDVLLDGRVFICGGEYGTGTTNAEIYDPSDNSWAVIPVPPGLIQTDVTIGSDGQNLGGFDDSSSVLLPDGQVLIAPVFPAYYGETVLYNPVLNSWTNASLANAGYDEDEASLVKLPDGSVLVIDFAGERAERFIPSLNSWIQDATCPVGLYDAYGQEMGAGFLLPNGNAFFIGSNPSYALYSPSGGTNDGSWIAEPSLPNDLGAPDAPAAMMVNGKVLCALSPTPTQGDVFTTPTYFYEYNYGAGSAGTFTQVHAPNGAYSLNSPTYACRMLDLPDGTVLFSEGFTNQLYVYVPDGTPLAAGKPAITQVSWRGDGTLTLSGTLFDGLSQGAAYGDDAQMDSNYPLVRFTDGPYVYYGQTYNWTSSSVMTGSNIMSTQCSVPSELTAGAACSMVVVANGIASDPVTFYAPLWVDFNLLGSEFQNGTYEYPYATLAQGTNLVATGGTIAVKADLQPSVSQATTRLAKRLTIISVYGPSTIGD